MRFAWICLLCAFSCQSSGDRKGPASDKAASSSQVPAQVTSDALVSTIRSQAQTPVRLPGTMSPAPWLADATRVVAYGGPEDAVIVAAGTGWLRWFSKDGELLGERLGAGGAQVLEVIDFDGDGSNEVLLGRGLARGANDAPAVMEVLRLEGKAVVVEPIRLPETSRAQIVAAHPVPGVLEQLWVASFVSKFEVEVNRFQRDQRGTWSLAESRGRHRVVGDMSVLPNGNPVIARMYGDAADEPGGVYELSAAGTALAIPSTRGARAVLAMPEPDQGVAMADGWHKEYGKKAQGLVSLARPAGEAWTRAAGVEVENNYGFSRLRLGDLHRLPGKELVASGNGSAHVVLPTRPELLFVLADRVAVDAYPIDLSGDSRMEVVIVGPEPSIWSAL